MKKLVFLLLALGASGCGGCPAPTVSSSPAPPPPPPPAAAGRQEAPDPGRVPQYLQALEGDNPLARQGAMTALGKIGAPAVAGLRGCLKGERPEVCSAAAHALGLIGADAKDAVPELRAA